MRIQSLLIGAAVAALVVVPANAANDWVNGAWKTYDAKSLKLESVIANVKVDVKDAGPMAVQISGLPERVKGVKVWAANNTLHVKCEEIGTVWDWRHWFDFSRRSTESDKLQIRIAVPRGSALDVEAMAGNVNIGSTHGKLRFEVVGNTQSSVGDVAELDAEMAGSGKLTVGNVAGTARAETAGSGEIRIGRVGGNAYAETAGSGDVRMGDVSKMKADIAGSGSISVGNVRGPIDVDIAGSGDFSAASVQGSTRADIAGSGSVSIGGGEANPLRVDIMGSGNVTFGGLAIDPKVDSMGSGSVRVKACRGSGCDSDDLKIGS